MHEPMQGMFSSSALMVLDFDQLTDDTPPEQDIRRFFEECKAEGVNPRLPENRQRFNNQMLKSTGARYLVSRYIEDRRAMLADTKIGQEGRTFHLGVDVFSADLEPVYAPCDGEIVAASYEAGFGEYGHYVILRSDELADTWFFFGHLSKDLPPLGKVKKGAAIARLGDYADNENGGWSRHLHLQVLRRYDTEAGTPPGYSTEDNLPNSERIYPNPLPYFADWRIAGL